MKRFLVETIWIFLPLVVLATGLLSQTSFVFAVIIAFLIYVWRYVLYRKRKKLREKIAPADVLQDLEFAERRYEESDGTADPQSILWEIAKSKQRGIRGSSSEIGRVTTGELSNEDGKQSPLSHISNPGTSGDKTDYSRSTVRFKGNNPKRLFRKRSGGRTGRGT